MKRLLCLLGRHEPAGFMTHTGAVVYCRRCYRPMGTWR